MESYQCKIDESGKDFTTGESLTIEKTIQSLPSDTLLADRKNMAFMGTCVASGRAVGVVVSTGMKATGSEEYDDIASSDTQKYLN